MRRQPTTTLAIAALCTLPLAACGDGEPAPTPAGPAGRTALRIDVTNVAWTNTSQDGNSSTWRKTGARVDLICHPPKVHVRNEAASSRDGTPNASKLCTAIASQASSLETDAVPVRPCDGNGYFSARVHVQGNVAGAAVDRLFTMCTLAEEGRSPTTAERWLRLLGMRPVGPDPPG